MQKSKTNCNAKLVLIHSGIKKKKKKKDTTTNYQTSQCSNHNSVFLHYQTTIPRLWKCESQQSHRYQACKHKAVKKFICQRLESTWQPVIGRVSKFAFKHAASQRGCDVRLASPKSSWSLSVSLQPVVADLLADQLLTKTASHALQLSFINSHHCNERNNKICSRE